MRNGIFLLTFLTFYTLAPQFSSCYLASSSGTINFFPPESSQMFEATLWGEWLQKWRGRELSSRAWDDWRGKRVQEASKMLPCNAPCVQVHMSACFLSTLQLWASDSFWCLLPECCFWVDNFCPSAIRISSWEKTNTKEKPDRPSDAFHTSLLRLSTTALSPPWWPYFLKQNPGRLFLAIDFLDMPFIWVNMTDTNFISAYFLHQQVRLGKEQM